MKELIINYLITTVNDRIDKLKKTGHIYIEGEFALQTHLTNKEKNALRFLEKQDITVKNILKRDYQGEKYQIVLLVIREEQYTVIHVPKKIQEMKYQDTKAKQLVQFQNEDWYPAFLTDKKLKSSLDKEWVIWQSEPNKNADGSPKVEMDVYNDGCHQEDIVRECAKKGMGMMSLTDIFILIELVNEKFGEL
ncbi:MAG: hypothetical protein LBP53_08045 [Candidatus Peribacteria bacterium]|nr:hypothetical protein [Candidatus Peribacteria bacterium]